MRRLLGSSVVLVALAAATVAAASPPWLPLSPAVVHRGGTVHLNGNADGCARGNAVFVISRAFVHAHEFAGVSAVLARVRAGGAFRATTVIPRTRRAGRYAVTARCGGGNLGVLVHLIVRR
jgi:cytochrome c biogenesis protein CcdA